ncbi:MAG: hypothetical protein ACK5QH_14315 [Rubrivivax sp.]
MDLPPGLTQAMPCAEQLPGTSPVDRAVEQRGQARVSEWAAAQAVVLAGLRQRFTLGFGPGQAGIELQDAGAFLEKLAMQRRQLIDG